MDRIIGQRIIAIRKLKKIKQKELAEMVGLKVSTLGNYERGYRPITVDNLAKITEALGISMVDLLTSEMRANDLTAYIETYLKNVLTYEQYTDLMAHVKQ